MATSTQNEIQIKFPIWHSGQKRILKDRRRFNVGALGRRSGKSLFSQYLLSEPAFYGRPTGYFAPTYKLLADTWRQLDARLSPVIRRSSSVERRMELITDGVMEFWTLEDLDAGRSRRYARVIIDEAGLCPHLGETWERAIRPTLADYKGDAYFLGTPKGRNFFWQLFQRGHLYQAEFPDWVSWQMPTSINPKISAEEIEAMRKGMTERSFRQEVMAEFLEDGGGVFRFVREAVNREERPASNQFTIGADWGRTDDYTVFIVMDSGSFEVVELVRFTKVEFTYQRMRLEQLWNKYNRPYIIAEQNSIGMPVIEQLQHDNIYVIPFNMSPASKQKVIDGLILAFEQKTIKLPNDETLLCELEAYEMERLPGGSLRYSAPEGQHDDCVIALALAWEGTNPNNKWESISVA